jgi:hypothetical protein
VFGILRLAIDRVDLHEHVYCHIFLFFRNSVSDLGMKGCLDPSILKTGS